MDRPDALAAYIRELRKERDAWLYQHALNKVRVITRSMKPDEKEAYLRSSAFGNTLAAIRRRDSVDQALSRGELPLSWQRAEFDRLAPLIRQELARGNDIRLGFLRAVSQSRVSPEKAHRARDLIMNNAPEEFFASRADKLAKTADQKTARYLQTGNLARMYAVQLSRAEHIIPRLMDTVFARGLTLPG